MSKSPATRPAADTEAQRRRPAGLIVAIALLVIAAVGALSLIRWFGLPDSDRTQTASQTGALVGGPFTLIDQDGRTVTDADYRGKYMLIYFGYTWCPDICPTSLGRNVEALDLLGDKANAIVPMLITIDPQRDTPERMKEYAGLFHPRMVALSGSQQQVADAAKAYRVYYAKAAEGGTGEDYLVDHSGFTYLMAPDGAFLQFFRHDLTPEQMAERIRKLL